MGGHFLPQKQKRRQNALADFGRRSVAALVADAQRGQSEAGGGNAGRGFVFRRAHVGAILGEAGVRVGLLPEVEETGVLKFFEKLVVLRGNRSGGRILPERRSSRDGRQKVAPGQGHTPSRKIEEHTGTVVRVEPM